MCIRDRKIGVGCLAICLAEKLDDIIGRTVDEGGKFLDADPAENMVVQIIAQQLRLVRDIVGCVFG